MPRLERARPSLRDSVDQLGDGSARDRVEAVELHAHLGLVRPRRVGIAELVEQPGFVARGQPQLEQVAPRHPRRGRDPRSARRDVQQASVVHLSAARELHRQIGRHAAVPADVVQLAQLPQRCQHTLRRMRGQVSERIAHR